MSPEKAKDFLLEHGKLYEDLRIPGLAYAYCNDGKINEKFFIRYGHEKNGTEFTFVEIDQYIYCDMDDLNMSKKHIWLYIKAKEDFERDYILYTENSTLCCVYSRHANIYKDKGENINGENQKN